MAKVRTTLIIDDDVLRAVRVRPARSGKRDSEVIEEALRRVLGLDLLDRLRSRGGDMFESEAMALALEAQRAARRKTGCAALKDELPLFAAAGFLDWPATHPGAP